MKNLLQILSIISVLAGYCLNISADQLVFPPAGLPEETWQMSFLDYNRYGKEYPNPTRSSEELTRCVTFVWDDNTVYVKGIFEDFPDSWIKGSLYGKKIQFDTAQLICELDTRLEEPQPVYAMNGVVKYEYCRQQNLNYPYWYEYSISFNLNGSTVDYDFYWMKFTLSDSGDSISSEVVTPSHSNLRTAFWHHTKPSGFNYFYRYEEEASEFYGSGFPKEDYPTSVQFTKVNGIVDAITDDSDSSDTITYDLCGRRVNSNTIHPGIYIRNGRKIIVK